MELTSESFSHDEPIPDDCALARPHPERHFTFAGNRNPHLAWRGVPPGARSLALFCVDPDAPSVPDDVNQEGRTVPAGLERVDFHHWILVDLPPSTTEIAAGSCSWGVTAGGKQDPPGPEGSRQGANDYTSWFAGDPEMRGTYFGYDGPAPPWNDERVHRYRFQLYALDVERLGVEGSFDAADARRAMQGHVLTHTELRGTYTLNPELRG